MNRDFPPTDETKYPTENGAENGTENLGDGKQRDRQGGNPDAQPSRTHFRFWVIGWTTLLAVLLYLDRFCVSIAELYIQQDLGLTDVQIGWMLSAFFWTYALAQVPSGWMTDRHGARIMMAIYVLAWSAFTGLLGVVQGFMLLLLLRFGFGLAQAGAYPTSAVILSHWAPVTSRGMASSIVSLGGRVGGAIAPILTALLIVMFVPLSTPSEFTAADLLQPTQFANRLVEDSNFSAADEESIPADSPRRLTRWVWNELSETTRAELRSLARGSVAGSGNDLENGLENLVEELNQLLLRRELSEHPGVPIEKLPHEGQRLIARPPEDLSPEQQARLNRLILESMDRRAIRQLYVHGWRPVMVTYGLLGIPLALGFWILFRNRPGEHFGCNEAERAWISRGKPKATDATRPRFEPVPLGALVTNRSMWLNCLSQCGTNVGWVFLVTWLPRYLENRHEVPVEQRAVMTFIPIAVGFAGMLVGGNLTDRLTAWLGPRWGRALPIGGSRFLAMFAYLVCLFDPSPWLAVAMFSVVGFATDLGIGATWAYVQDVGGRHIGSVLGWGNMWGNLGAAATPPFLIWVVGANQNWEAAFWTCALAFLIAGIAGLGIDATRPLQPEE
jgi:MFS transporter, ACS family, glucarate transporter